MKVTSRGSAILPSTNPAPATAVTAEHPAALQVPLVVCPIPRAPPSGFLPQAIMLSRAARCAGVDPRGPAGPKAAQPRYLNDRPRPAQPRPPPRLGGRGEREPAVLT